MASLENINLFTSGKKIAIVGVSANQKKFSSVIYKDLKKKGYELAAVNPKYSEINGEKCHKSVKELDKSFENLLVVLPDSQIESVVNEAIENGLKIIWLQKNRYSQQTIALAEKHNVKLISGECIYMWTDPKGIHKLHRGLRSIFGKMPS